MTLLTDEYRTFMDTVQRDHNAHGDKYENSDPQYELQKHYNLDSHLAKKIYDEWILSVFTRMPWKPNND